METQKIKLKKCECGLVPQLASNGKHQMIFCDSVSHRTYNGKFAANSKVALARSIEAAIKEWNSINMLAGSCELEIFTKDAIAKQIEKEKPVDLSKTKYGQPLLCRSGTVIYFLGDRKDGGYNLLAPNLSFVAYDKHGNSIDERGELGSIANELPTASYPMSLADIEIARTIVHTITQSRVQRVSKERAFEIALNARFKTHTSIPIAEYLKFVQNTRAIADFVAQEFTK